jgi:xanthine/uracil permease
LCRRYAEHVLRKLFPPIVTGTAIMLIGAGLTGTGIKYWGGGAVCAETAWKNHQHALPLIGFGPIKGKDGRGGAS